VPAYGGIAAVDCYIGATEVVENDPLNSVYPGEFNYGGGHVIEDLVPETLLNCVPKVTGRIVILPGSTREILR